MEKGAKSIYKNLFEVLDLKQKHANFVEVRISRDRALEAVQRGRTIMMFTVVTIIFLPTVFMATFFVINIFEFPYAKDRASLGIRSQYMFSIGLAVQCL
jgi:Mg2+ and Co2+ transporter CorA